MAAQETLVSSLVTVNHRGQIDPRPKEMAGRLGNKHSNQTVCMAEDIYFEGTSTCILIAAEQGGPRILYWGKKIPIEDARLTGMMHQRAPAAGTPSIEESIRLSPTMASGFVGMPGLEMHADGQVWDVLPDSVVVAEQSAKSASIRWRDSRHGIDLEARLTWCPESGVLALDHRLTNDGDRCVTVDWCCAGAVPVSSHLDLVTSFHGRWALEFQQNQLSLPTGAFVRESRRGRTSHASFPGLVMQEGCTSESQGEAFGFHLGWSGNHRLIAEKLNDGRIQVQMGELLLPGEVRLERGETYQTPTLYGSYSAEGLSKLSQNFHDFVRTKLLREVVRSKPRPVHYNTWEAVYFDHRPERLMQLANKAAEVGVERFVLDDGWFLGRRNDAAGLGDWFVDLAIYPDGLGPLIDHVRSLGMEFGLWVEPEMVNPDSDLYRAHPGWVLSAPGIEQIPSRNQLVLDLTKAEVTAYLFERLDALLTEHDIAYLKWDMNRDIHHPGNDGQAVTHRQTLAVYELIERVRRAHPLVEIESCASGGARADYGVLAHTDRIWTSDSNDAIDRQSIQRGASFFFPSLVLGAHVGPRTCHITGRMLSMEMRAATALFGHMGMELDLAEMTEDEAKTLKNAVDIHKKHRSLIHSGDVIRLDSPKYANAFMMASKDQNEALVSYAQVGTRAATTPELLRLRGLNAKQSYQLNVVWPQTDVGVALDQLDHLNGMKVSGAVLMSVGMQLPAMNPETAVILHLSS